MNLKKLIILLFFLTRGIANAQNNNCIIPIQIEIGDSVSLLIKFTKGSFNSDTINVLEGYFSICNLEDCRGSMKIKDYKGSILIEEGNYINSIDTFKECVVEEDPFNPGKQKVAVEKYFQPLKDGIWKYYDEKGILIKQENWDKGILIEQKRFDATKKKKIKKSK